MDNMWSCPLALAVVALAPLSGYCGDRDIRAASCESLGTADFSTIPDAPTQIKDAKLTEASHEAPAHCDIQAYIWPNIGIKLLLPNQWNGKLIELGCGAYCGSFIQPTYGDCNDPLTKGYVCIASDAGNRSTGLEGKWAYNDLPAKIDYAYRSAHVTALVGKAIAGHYYRMAPTRSYFVGCSGGGRQGAVEAQRFPLDFDGIVAMEPSLNLSAIIMAGLWNGLAVRTPDGKALFAQQDVELLHRTIVKKCDMNDGIKDGLIGDPRLCQFDPAELSCKAGQAANCLTLAQVEAARKVYSGPLTSSGESITGRGAFLGSEIDGFWGMSSYLAGSADQGVVKFATEFFRYMAFVPDPGPRWEAKDFDFDRDYKRLEMMDRLYDATDPDLRSFKARGGKLILIQGLHDSGAPNAYGSIDYYETVEKTLGGAATTRDFFRLFLVPGRNHCGGGDGAWAIDDLTYLEQWVEKGIAPDVIISAHPKGTSLAVHYPLPADAVTFTRPVYPYPARAYYKGKGNPNDAASFEPR